MRDQRTRTDVRYIYLNHLYHLNFLDHCLKHKELQNTTRNATLTLEFQSQNHTILIHVQNHGQCFSLQMGTYRKVRNTQKCMLIDQILSEKWFSLSSMWLIVETTLMHARFLNVLAW
uniref:Uncharacterized protein n=1 Tax=Romanomermis culicivorax TaxID=13658 RepID=A0A915JHY1_ROMCU